MAYAWSLLGVFKEIAENIWVDEGPKIDNTTLRLNYKVTVSFLLVTSGLVTFYDWFGIDNNPVECVANEKLPKYINDFCWLHPKEVNMEMDNWTEERFDQSTVMEGVGQTKDKDKVFTIHYYQWTPFFLLFQAICFYAARFVWTRWENGTMAFFKKSLDKADWTDEQKAEAAAEILIERSEKKFNDMYALGYMVSELVAIANIVLQWILTTVFLGTVVTNWESEEIGNVNFLNLGWKVMTSRRTYLPTRMLFPRVSICHWRKPGTGGGISGTQANCLLPINIINDKIFLALWFWLVFVSLLTGLNFIYRVLMYLYKDLRKKKLSWDVLKREKEQQADWQLDSICKKHSDFLVFENFSENFSTIVVRKTLLKIAERSQRDEIDIARRKLGELDQLKTT